MNYFPCPKCDSYSSKILEINSKNNIPFNKEIYIKLLCSKNCSLNYLKFSNIMQLLNNQSKLQISFPTQIKEKYDIEIQTINIHFTETINNLNDIINKINKISDLISQIKLELNNKVNSYKSNLENLIVIYKLIYGTYNKELNGNIPNNAEKNFKFNLNKIKINNKIEDDFYLNEITKDFNALFNNINNIQKEIDLYLYKNNNLIEINQKPDKVHKNKHNNIKKFDVDLNIEKIIKLKDGNLVLGAEKEMLIYNLELKKIIKRIAGNFSKIVELKYQNKKDIEILSYSEKKIVVYDIYNNKTILKYNQYNEIDAVFELYNGDILFITDFSIFNTNFSKEFKIDLSYMCYGILNLIDKKNILLYSQKNLIIFCDLDKPRKQLMKINVNDENSCVIFDIKQLFLKDEENYLLILTNNNYLSLFDLNKFNFICNYSCNQNFFSIKVLNFSNDNNNNIYLIGNNEVDVVKLNNTKFTHIHSIKELKNRKSDVSWIYESTPFDISDNGKYVLIFESNRNGFNVI